MKPNDPCPHLHVRDGPMTIVTEDGVRTHRQIGMCLDCGYAVERIKPLPKFGEWRTVSEKSLVRSEYTHVRRAKEHRPDER
jgi:hypothetical protein